MTQQKPELQRISDLLNDSMVNIPKGQGGKQSPPDDHDPKPGCLDRLQAFTLRLLTLGAIVTTSALFGALVTIGFVPPQITVNIPQAVITAPPIIITTTPIIVISNPMTVTATPLIVVVEVTKEVPVTVEFIREIPVTVEVIKEIPVTVEVIKEIPSLPGPSPTANNRSGGITYENYQLIQNDMTHEQVIEILGEEGIEGTNSGKYVFYKWRGASGTITIMFDNGKVTSKSQTLK